MGGCAYNVANILGKAGSDIHFVSPVGTQGIYGPFVLENLRKEAWSSPVVLSGRENGCCYCLVEQNGERTFLSVHGVEYSFSSSWVKDIAADYTYICGLEVEENTGEELVNWLESAPCGQIVYAPGPRGAQIPGNRTKRLMQLHPILHLNQHEAMEMAGKETPQEAARVLYQNTGRTVFITLGEKGALAYDGELHSEKGFRTEVTDTIGAGDAHAAAVLFGLSEGLPVQSILERANRVASAVAHVAGSTLDERTIKSLLYV